MLTRPNHLHSTVFCATRMRREGERERVTQFSMVIVRCFEPYDVSVPNLEVEKWLKLHITNDEMKEHTQTENVHIPSNRMLWVKKGLQL